MEYWYLSDNKLEARTALLGLENMVVDRDFRENGSKHVVLHEGEDIFYVTVFKNNRGEPILRLKDAETGIILLQKKYRGGWGGMQRLIQCAAVYFYPISTIGRRRMEALGLEFKNDTIIET